MKRTLALLLTLVMALAFTACGSKGENKTTTEAATPSSTMYKDIMGDAATFEKEPRIVIFQNAINSTFLNNDTKPTAEKKTVDGATLDAYAIKGAADILLKAPTADVTIVSEDGKKTTLAADKFLSAYVATAEDGSSILVATGTTVKNLKYAITADNEAIVFVKPSETIVMKDLFTALGFAGTAKTYRFVATDKFYLETTADECATAEIRGTLSGAVNASLPIETASGKINDILYVDMID